MPGTEVLRDGPDSMANVVAGQFQSRSVLTNAPQGDMYMGMLSIEMRHGHPFQLCSEVSLHACHQLSAQPIKVEPKDDPRKVLADWIQTAREAANKVAVVVFHPRSGRSRSRHSPCPGHPAFSKQTMTSTSTSPPFALRCSRP